MVGYCRKDGGVVIYGFLDYATYNTCHRNKPELILVLEIADDVVDKEPWI